MINEKIDRLEKIAFYAGKVALQSPNTVGSYEQWQLRKLLDAIESENKKFFRDAYLEWHNLGRVPVTRTDSVHS